MNVKIYFFIIHTNYIIVIWIVQFIWMKERFFFRNGEFLTSHREKDEIATTTSTRRICEGFSQIFDKLTFEDTWLNRSWVFEKRKKFSLQQETPRILIKFSHGVSDNSSNNRWWDEINKSSYNSNHRVKQRKRHEAARKQFRRIDASWRYQFHLSTFPKETRQSSGYS